MQIAESYFVLATGALYRDEINVNIEISLQKKVYNFYKFIE